MKTVLCYGDSLTWGYSAEGPSRHPLADRWPSVLQVALGDTVTVIPEGLNGRTTAYDDHTADADRNGVRLLPTILATHSPLDLVIILLGANDMKPFISGDAYGSKQGMERLVDIARRHVDAFAATPPQVLIVSPPALRLLRCRHGCPDNAARRPPSRRRQHPRDRHGAGAAGATDAGTLISRRMSWPNPTT